MSRDTGTMGKVGIQDQAIPEFCLVQRKILSLTIGIRLNLKPFCMRAREVNKQGILDLETVSRT